MLEGERFGGEPGEVQVLPWAKRANGRRELRAVPDAVVESRLLTQKLAPVNLVVQNPANDDGPSPEHG